MYCASFGSFVMADCGDSGAGGGGGPLRFWKSDSSEANCTVQVHMLG